MKGKGCRCSKSEDPFRGLPKFKSSALFLVDPHQRAQFNMAGLQNYIEDWLNLPVINVDRVIQFVNSFSPSHFRGAMEGSTVRISEEYVAVCLRLLDSCSVEAAPGGEKNVYRLCARNLAEYRAYVTECFEAGSSAEVVGKGWKKSQLRGRCKDIVFFVQARLWDFRDDLEFVDAKVVQAVLGVMSGKQFAWARHLSRLMKEDIAKFQAGDEVYRSTNWLRSARYLSMLIEFQIGPKVPPRQSTVTIVHVDQMLEVAEKQNSALVKRLVVLEEETKELRRGAVQSASAAHSAEEHLKSQLVKAEAEVSQCKSTLAEALKTNAQLTAQLVKAQNEFQKFKIDWAKDQLALSTELSREKAYSQAVFKSHTKYKAKCDRLWDELKDSERQNCELLESLKEATCTSSDPSLAIVNNATIVNSVV